MKGQFQSGLRTVMFLGLAAVAGGCLAPEAAPDESDSGDMTSEAVSALSGTQRVCTWATIRRTPHGQVFGFLLPGDNFRVDSCGSNDPSAWCSGHAYGHVHEDGYIELMHLQGC